MTEDSERIQIDCSLGEMDLSVDAPEDSAVEIFERVWKARIDEKQTADAIEMRDLERREEWSQR